MTECNQSAFPFEAHFSRQVVAAIRWRADEHEGGVLLLRQADHKIELLKRVASCFIDARDPQRVAHGLSEMLAQRIYGLALGYEDLNDHEELRRDPLLAVVAGKREMAEPLAGKSTLNRLELNRRDRRSRSATTRSPIRPKPWIRCWSKSSWKRTASRLRKCAGSRCDRHAAARPAGGALFSMATTITTVTCRCTFSREIICCARGCVLPTRRQRRESGRSPAYRRADSRAVETDASHSARAMRAFAVRS